MTALTSTSWRCATKYSWKLIGPSTVSNTVAIASSLTGSNLVATPKRSHSSRVTSLLVAPSRQSLGAVEVRREVAVAQAEPRRAAEPAELVHDAPGLAGQSPPGHLVVERGERVGDRVEVRADRQAVQDEVVADVDHRGEVALGDDESQGAQQARGADAATQYGEHLRDTRGTSVTSVVVIDDLLDGWPVGSSAMVVRVRHGMDEVLESQRRPGRAARVGLGLQDGRRAGLRRRERLGTARVHRERRASRRDDRQSAEPQRGSRTRRGRSDVAGRNPAGLLQLRRRPRGRGRRRRG